MALRSAGFSMRLSRTYLTPQRFGRRIRVKISDPLRKKATWHARWRSLSSEDTWEYEIKPYGARSKSSSSKKPDWRIKKGESADIDFMEGDEVVSPKPLWKGFSRDYFDEEGVEEEEIMENLEDLTFDRSMERSSSREEASAKMPPKGGPFVGGPQRTETEKDSSRAKPVMNEVSRDKVEESYSNGRQANNSSNRSTSSSIPIVTSRSSIGASEKFSGMDFEKDLLTISEGEEQTPWPPSTSSDSYEDDIEGQEIEHEEVLSFLEDHGLEYREKGSQISVKECPFCHPIKGDPSNMYKLGINTEKGACYNCLRCGASGTWRHFKIELSGSGNGLKEATEVLKKNVDKSIEEPKVMHQHSTSSFTPKPELSSSRNVEHFERNLKSMIYKSTVDRITKERGISREVLEFYRCGLDNFSFGPTTSMCITFPIIAAPGEFDHDSRVSFSSDEEWVQSLEIQRLKVRDISNKANQRSLPSGAPTGLFGWHTVPRDKKSIVVTEGEFDAMAVYQATKHPAVSLPNGAKAILPEVVSALQKFEHVYIWMDQDEAGRAGAQKLGKEIGLRKCSIITMNSDVKDANEALLKGLDLPKCLSSAEKMKHKRLLLMKDMMPKFEHYLLNPPSQGVPFQCFPGLTGTLKGHRAGELTVFTGPTGAGKTTFLSQLTVDLALQGVSTLWGSFEIANERLLHTMIHQYASREGKRNCSLPRSDEIIDLWERRKSFMELPLSFMDFFGATSINDVVDVMEGSIESTSIDHIVIDNLQFMMGDFGKSRRFSNGVFEKMEEMDFAFSQFRKFATDNQIHVTVVVHPRKESEGERLSMSSFYGSGKATQEADNVLILQAPRGSQKFIEVKKNRFDGTQGIMALDFEPAYKTFLDVSEVGQKTRDEEETKFFISKS